MSANFPSLLPTDPLDLRAPGFVRLITRRVARFRLQGTPGGDFAELAGAIQAYYNLTGVSAVNTSDIRAILTAFMDQVETGNTINQLPCNS